MKNFTLKLKSTLCMLIALFGIHAYAQESITVGEVSVPVVSVQTVNAEDAAKATYSGKTAEFSVATVTEALGIASITEAAEYIVNPTTWVAVENTSDGWRNGEGDLCGWGDITEETRGYCVKIQEPESGLVDYLGAHHNGVWNEGETFTAYWGFVAGDKAALVKVVVTFGPEEEGGEEEPEEPAIELPEPETTIANLQIVGTAEISHERYYTQGYETTDLALVIPSMAEALGVEKETLGQAFSQMIYIDQYSEGTNTGVMAPLTLTDGWMRTYIDSETDEMTDEMVGAMYGGDDDVFIQRMAYNAASDSVTFVMGQMPGGLELGEKRFVNLYVVYGQKAFVIKYSVTFVEPPFNGLDGMTKVGEQTINLSQQPTNDYSAVSFSIDLEAIATLLGTENTTEIQMQGLTEMGGLSNDHTANNGGWWFDNMGNVHSYAGGAFYIEPQANNTWTNFNVGQMPDLAHGGEEYVAKLYLTYAENYYELTVMFNIEEEEEPVDPNELHVVAQRTITINQQLDTNYAWSNSITIPFDYIVETIGTASPRLYSYSQESTEENPIYTDKHSCDPKPGFWMTADGKATTWGNSSPWGMSIALENPADGIAFNCIQFPDQTAIGDTFKGSFFLVNLENAAMLQVNVIYNIVENADDSEVVGEESFTLEVSNDECHAPIDLANIAAKLGVESEEALMDIECLRAVNETGIFAAPTQPANGVTVDENGFAGEDENVGIYVDGGMIYTYCNSEALTNWKANVELCFENDGKRYLIHVTLLSSDLYVGIKEVNKNTANAIFDLQGRKMQNAQKGIYIMNGVKVVK